MEQEYGKTASAKLSLLIKKCRLWDCHTQDKDPTHQNQEWNMNRDGTFVNPESNKCLEASSGMFLYGHDYSNRNLAFHAFMIQRYLKFNSTIKIHLIV